METVGSAGIAAAVGFLLSLTLAFVPGLKPWFAAIPSDRKPLTVLGLCAVVGVALVALACFGVDAGQGAVCPPVFSVATAWALAANIIAAAGAAQSTFALLVNPMQGNGSSGAG